MQSSAYLSESSIELRKVWPEQPELLSMWTGDRYVHSEYIAGRIVYAMIVSGGIWFVHSCRTFLAGHYQEIVMDHAYDTLLI